MLSTSDVVAKPAHGEEKKSENSEDGGNNGKTCNIKITIVIIVIIIFRIIFVINLASIAIFTISLVQNCERVGQPIVVTTGIKPRA